MLYCRALLITRYKYSLETETHECKTLCEASKSNEGANCLLLLLAMDSSLPIFSVQKVELAFSVASDFIAAQVANNVLVLALQSGRIMRIDLESPADIDGRSCSSHERRADGR